MSHPIGCQKIAEVAVNGVPYCYGCASHLTNLSDPTGIDLLGAGAGRCAGSGTPDVFDTDHPTITEAVAWLESTDTVPITRATAETLLPHWEHYSALTGREREGVLNRFGVSKDEQRYAAAGHAMIAQAAAQLGVALPADGEHGMPVTVVEDLAVGDWFIDPVREGGRPAKVISITGVFSRDDGARRIHFSLDDHTRWLPWAGSYPLGTRVELIGAERGAQLDREAAAAAAQAEAAQAEYRKRLDAWSTDQQRLLGELHPDE